MRGLGVRLLSRFGSERQKSSVAALEWLGLGIHPGAACGRSRGAVGSTTGVCVITCGYCSTSLFAQNLMIRAGPDGRLADGYRRLHCTSYSKNAGCGEGGSYSVIPVEHPLLQRCSDQMSLQRLFEPAYDNQPFASS